MPRPPAPRMPAAEVCRASLCTTSARRGDARPHGAELSKWTPDRAVRSRSFACARADAEGSRRRLPDAVTLLPLLSLEEPSPNGDGHGHGRQDAGAAADATRRLPVGPEAPGVGAAETAWGHAYPTGLATRACDRPCRRAQPVWPPGMRLMACQRPWRPAALNSLRLGSTVESMIRSTKRPVPGERSRPSWTEPNTPAPVTR
jgi:hypothetical protein